LRVAGYAHSGRDAITEVRRLQPDVVLLDVRLPDKAGPALIPILRAERPEMKIILFTAYPDDASLAAGADGVLVKDADRANLIDAISRVAAGERIVRTGADADQWLLLDRKLRDHGITRREYEILRHVAMGKTNPEIAVALGLARNTVKTYLQRAFEKLGARNRVEVLVRASQLGIL
jgi:DNA-binding NarL/FixJ family response regulator